MHSYPALPAQIAPSPIAKLRPNEEVPDLWSEDCDHKKPSVITSWDEILKILRTATSLHVTLPRFSLEPSPNMTVRDAGDP